MNQCIFSGNLVRKPELKYVGDDKTPVVNFTIAINSQFTDRGGEKKKEVIYVDCEAWAEGAECISRNCDKGDYLIVYDTRVRNVKWTDSDGKPCSRVKFRVGKFEFVPGTRRHKDDTSQAPPADDENNNNQESEADIPF